MRELAPDGPTMSRNEAERRIRELAERFHVSAKKSTFDHIADNFARLSDAETSVDEVELLLIHLIRKRAIDGSTALDLHASYLSGSQNKDLVPFDPFGDYSTKGYLRNRLAERDLQNVRKLEHVGFSGRVVESLTYLTSQPYLTYENLLHTHRILFDFLYPWAGSDRKTTAPSLSIGKGQYKDLFARPDEIELACDSALNMPSDELANRPGIAFARLAYAHPFLDMNGRTILTFHSAMIRRVHIYVRWDHVAKDDFLSKLTEDLIEERGALDLLIKPHVYSGRKHAKTLARFIDETTHRRT